MARRDHSILSQFRELKNEYLSEYAAGTPGRFRRARPGVGTTGTSGDQHYSEALYLAAVEYVRDMHRNDAIIPQTTRRAVQQQVQSGFRVDPQTGNRKLSLALWERWTEWSEDPDLCDASGEMAFADMEAEVFHAMLRDGEEWALLLDDGSVQLMEAHRPRTPHRTRRNVVLGVEMDERRRRVAVWFNQEEISTFRKYLVRDLVRRTIRDEDGNRQVLQIYHPGRVTQTRGMTAYHPIIDIAGMWEDTNFALLVKQQVAACLAWFLKRTQNAGSDPTPGARTTELLSNGSTALLDEITPGLLIKGAVGEELEMKAPNIPSSETMAHLRFLLQIIGINLGLPLVLVLLDASETNFSGWRGALDAARVGFRCNQQQFIRRFHRPIWMWKVREWLNGNDGLGRDLRRFHELASGGDSKVQIFRHRWQTPSWPYVQPLDDAKADAFRINNLLASPRQVAAERFRDFDDIVDETVADNARAVLRALKAVKRIKETFPDAEVGWRDILNRDLYRGGQMFDSADAANQTADGAANGN